jgi:hypothetical protein
MMTNLLKQLQAELLAPAAHNSFLVDKPIQQSIDVAEQDEETPPTVADDKVIEAPPHPSKLINAAKRSPKKAKLCPLALHELLEVAICFLHHHGLHTINCPSLSRKKNRNQTCSCMTLFIEDVHSDTGGPTKLTESVGRYIVYFSQLPKSARQSILMEWIRWANIVSTMSSSMRDPKTPATGREHCCFLIPIITLPDDSSVSMRTKR